jgi:CheY-like chemotaxis protein
MLTLPQSCTPNGYPLQTLSADFTPKREDQRQTQVSEPAVRQQSARILSIGNDPILLYSRRLVLETAGYIVDSMTAHAPVAEAQLSGFDLVIICHSVPDEIMGQIVATISRVNPQTPVLLVARLENLEHVSPLRELVSPRPAAILQAVARQLAVHRHEINRVHPES